MLKVFSESFRAAQVEIARLDVVRAIEHWGYDDEGEPLIMGPMRTAWFEFIDWCWENGLHALIIAPWESGKSECIAVHFPMWLLGRSPNLRILEITNIDPLAVARVDAVRGLLKENPKYADVFPDMAEEAQTTKEEMSRHRLKLRGVATKDYSLVACAILSTQQGMRGDINLFDDPTDEGKTILEPSRGETTIFKYDNTFLKAGKLVESYQAAICTRWTDNVKVDLVANWLKRKGWAALIQTAKRGSLDCIEQEVVYG